MSEAETQTETTQLPNFGEGEKVGSESTASQPTDWRQSLDADLRQSPFAQKYESLSEAIKAANHLQSKIGEKGLVLPKPDEPAEAWDPIYQALGRPDEPAGYAESFEDWEKPDGWNDQAGAEALQLMHQHGMTGKQARAVVEWAAGRAKAEREEQGSTDASLHSDWNRALREKWGSASETQFAMAEQAAGEIEGIENLLEARLPGGGQLRYHPGFRDFLARVGQTFREHKMIDGEAPRHSNTPESAEQKINAFMADKEKVAVLYGSKQDPRFPQVAEEWRKLHEQAYPGSSSSGAGPVYGAVEE